MGEPELFIHRVTDWDGAYANGANIPGGERWPDLWVAPAADYRAVMAKAGRSRIDNAYGDGERQRFDLFLPVGEPRGLVVFIHGGYWMRFDKSYWSHLAQGAVENGHAVAMPSYTLSPQARIGDITIEIARAVATAAEAVQGDIRLVGHSAGGHLATRMICRDGPLSPAVQARIVITVSISGLHDLRPLMRTAMNETLGIDAKEATAESPALLEPVSGSQLLCWVGAGERAEFIRQSALLANAWTGLGAATAFVAEPDRHHFDIVDGLANPRHALTEALLR